jgi:hypothetical protein
MMGAVDEQPGATVNDAYPSVKRTDEKEPKYEKGR